MSRVSSITLELLKIPSCIEPSHFLLRYALYIIVTAEAVTVLSRRKLARVFNLIDKRPNHVAELLRFADEEADELINYHSEEPTALEGAAQWKNIAIITRNALKDINSQEMTAKS